MINTYEGILSATKELAKDLPARSAEIERKGAIPADIIDKLRAAGIFRMGFPTELGGPGLTSMQQIEVIEAISYGDTSVGWCAMIGMDGGLYGLHDSAVREMFPSLDVAVAGMLTPVGRAVRVPGGYRVTGRWTMASGIHHAEWVSSGAVVIDENGEKEISASGKPYWRVMMTPRGKVELIENWDATGLSGSGSVDYRFNDVFVPESHTFSLGEPTRTGALAAPDALMRKMPGVALGAARAALDYVREVARTEIDSVTGQPWAEDYRMQFALAECEMDFITMRHGVYGSLEERWYRMEGGVAIDDLTPDERVAVPLARLNALRGARSIVRELYDMLGTTSIYQTSPIERRLRDLETVCQQIMAQDKIVQSCGAFLLGGKPEFPLVLGFV